MRSLEALLSSVNLLAFLALLLPWHLRPKWMRYAAPAAIYAASAQLLVEGPRWQMVPAYALSLVFLLIWLVEQFRPHPSTRRPTLSLAAFRAVAMLGLAALAVSFALPLLVPVFRLPPPTGPHPVGTVTFHWVDSTRPEVITDEPEDRRELMVQVWYPAKPAAEAEPAPYVVHPEKLEALARILGLPPFTFSHLNYVNTGARSSAPAAGGRPYPVLLFAHGRGGFRQHNTAQIQDLASHGYVVAAIEQPYVASGVVFPDGRIAPLDPRMVDSAHSGRAPLLDRILPFLARDARFTLDRLTVLNRTPGGVLTGAAGSRSNRHVRPLARRRGDRRGLQPGVSHPGLPDDGCVQAARGSRGGAAPALDVDQPG